MIYCIVKLNEWELCTMAVEKADELANRAMDKESNYEKWFVDSPTKWGIKFLSACWLCFLLLTYLLPFYDYTILSGWEPKEDLEYLALLSFMGFVCIRS